MQIPTTVACFCALLVISGQVLWSQQTPAQPVSEHKYTAGESFVVAIHLTSAAKISERVIANYHRKDPPKLTESAVTQPAGDIDFSCIGYVNPAQLDVTVVCTTSRKLISGEYVSDGVLTLQRIETGDSIKTPSPTRFPIVTIIANPYEDLNLPVVASTTLVFSAQQALDDGSQQSDRILQQLNAHYPGQINDTEETRRYLASLAEQERRIIDNTRKFYESAIDAPQIAATPVVFQDFDRRLKKLLNDLGQKPVQISVQRRIPHLMLASDQRPTMHESVSAESQPSKLNKSASDLADILIDAVRGFLGMKNSGITAFKWSLITDPAGASLYVSRLDEPETQFAGATPFIDQKLEYARWRFRIDWNGCWKTQEINPFLQSDIKMTISKAGCKTK